MGLAILVIILCAPVMAIILGEGEGPFLIGLAAVMGACIGLLLMMLVNGVWDSLDPPAEIPDTLTAITYFGEGDFYKEPGYFWAEKGSGRVSGAKLANVRIYRKPDITKPLVQHYRHDPEEVRTGLRWSWKGVASARIDILLPGEK